MGSSELLERANAKVGALEENEKEAKKQAEQDKQNALAAKKAEQVAKVEAKVEEKAAKAKAAQEVAAAKASAVQQKKEETAQQKKQKAADTARTALEEAMKMPGGHKPRTLTTKELAEGFEERPKTDLISKLTRALNSAKDPKHGDLIPSQQTEDAQTMETDLKDHKKKLKEHEALMLRNYTAKGADSLQNKICEHVQAAIKPLVADLDDDAGPRSPEKPNLEKAESGKFLCDPEKLGPSQGQPDEQGQLKFGDTDGAMVSLEQVLKHKGVPEDDAEALKAIRDEFERNGSDDDKLCMKYVLDQAAGSCEEKWQQGLMLDCDANGKLRADRTVDGQPGGQGKTLQHFCAEAKGLSPPLSPPEVAAIRLYTTKAYKKINDPLREGDDAAPDHPLPVTLLCLNKALKKLRDKNSGDGQLWRGFKDKKVPDDFLRSGGMELGAMSTTTSLKTAIEYSDSDNRAFNPAIMRITCKTYQQRGVNISCFSAFPAEEEILFPPRSTLFPVQKGAAPTALEVAVGEGKKKTWMIYDVEGYFPSI